MTERQLFLAIGDVDDELVAWAAHPRVRQSGMRWGAVAAAAAIVILLSCVYMVWRQGGTGDLPVQEPGTSTTAPTTATTTPTTQSAPQSETAPGGLPWLSGQGITSTGIQGGYGYTYAYDISELRFASEWPKPPATMSVWRICDEYNASFELHKDIIRRYAALLGDREITDDEFATGEGSDSRDSVDGGRSTRLTTEQYTYTVDSDHPYICINLAEPVDAGDEAGWLSLAQSVAPALFAEMAEPTLRVTGGDRSWVYREGQALGASEQLYDVRVYDAADVDGAYAAVLKGVKLDIINGKLTRLYVYLSEYYEKLGEYPVLSEKEARAQLDIYCEESLKKGLDDIARDYEVLGMELTYVSNSLSRLRVPVYRFLLTPPDNGHTSLIAESGLKCYREIYISAVPKEYWRSGTDVVYYDG